MSAPSRLLLAAAFSAAGPLACSGPDLTPAPGAVGEPEAPLVIPEGGQCGPGRMTAAEAPPVMPDAAPRTPACSETAAAPSVHSPLSPLGVGYPGGPETPLPRGVAYLTFDDGPSEWTLEFLDILRDKGARATFFVTAKQFKGEDGLDGTYTDDAGNSVVYRDVLARTVQDGHQLANHTVNHPDIGRITREQLTSEIEQNELLVNRALLRAGAKPQLMSLFRPPYGSPWFTGIAGKADPLASQRISSHGLNILWNVPSTDSSDWAIGESYSRSAEPEREPDAPPYALKLQRLLESVLGHPAVAQGDGVIVLMHDTHNTTRDVLAQMIDGLAARGYSFETIEHYVQWRWGRPSIDLTPGPYLYEPCIEERHWGCVAVDGVPLGTDRSREICGRMWLAYEALGGLGVLGRPLAEPTQSEETGIVSQEFEAARVELHPENPAPCNVIAIPR